MTTTAPPLLERLTPDGGDDSHDFRVLKLPCGSLWDVLRTDARLALPVLLQLHDDEDDLAMLGPVLYDGRTETVYWLISPGHTANWPEDCELLTTGDWLTVPNTGEPHRLVWLHMPAKPIVTAPPWLAIVLGEQAAALELDAITATGEPT